MPLNPRTALLNALGKVELTVAQRQAAIEEWEERSALMEFDGQMTRLDAEWAAASLVSVAVGGPVVEPG